MAITLSQVAETVRTTLKVAQPHSKAQDADRRVAVIIEDANSWPGAQKALAGSHTPQRSSSVDMETCSQGNG